MNKNPVPKSENVASAVAEKTAPVVVKAATGATVAASPSRIDAATKVTRVGNAPVAKKMAVKPAVKPAAATKVVRNTVAKAAAPAVKRPAAAKPAVAKPAAAKPAAVKPVVVKPVAAVKEKAKKAKLVRDSFTMPEDEFAVLGKVKKTSLKAGFNVKKSELLRIGVALVDKLSVAQLQSALAGLMPLKAGRPKKDK
ncbi:MAG: hypothetical protein HHJ09_10820 [Glaciimonas sp.]|nr:hypothetical protein [Glaciimonas sp.]